MPNLFPTQSHLKAAATLLWEASQKEPPTPAMEHAAELIRQAQEVLRTEGNTIQAAAPVAR